MFNYLTQFAAQSGLLGLNLEAFVIQLITFILAIVILERFASKPILKMLDRRRRTIEDGVNLGEQMKRDKAKLDDKVAAQLQQARQQADEIIASAEDTAKTKASEIEAKARDKAEVITSSAEERAEQEVKQARKRLEKEVASLVADASSAVLEEKVDATKDKQLIERAVEAQVKA